jgi:hypothetical protein
MTRRPARRRVLAVGVFSIGLAFALAPTAANAVHHAPASLKSPTPPKTGPWKVNDSQDVTSGSLVVYKHHGKLEIKQLHGVLNSFNTASGCAPGPFTVKGSLAIRKVKVSKVQDAWAVSNGWGGRFGPGYKPVHVEVVYGGKTVPAELQVGFADPHYKPVVRTYNFENVGYFNSFAGHDCEINFGLKRK